VYARGKFCGNLKVLHPFVLLRSLACTPSCRPLGARTEQQCIKQSLTYIATTKIRHLRRQKRGIKVKPPNKWAKVKQKHYAKGIRKIEDNERRI